jgi:hypothetical protein
MYASAPATNASAAGAAEANAAAPVLLDDAPVDDPPTCVTEAVPMTVPVPVVLADPEPDGLLPEAVAEAPAEVFPSATRVPPTTELGCGPVLDPSAFFAKSDWVSPVGGLMTPTIPVWNTLLAMLCLSHGLVCVNHTFLAVRGEL